MYQIRMESHEEGMRSPEGTRLSDIAYMSGSQGRAGLVATKSSRIPIRAV